MEKIYADKHGQAFFRCPHCSFKRSFDAESYRNRDSRIVIKCRCGKSVPVLIDFRGFYRKAVSLYGECFFHKLKEIFPIEIDSLSLDGISFFLINVSNAQRFCAVGDKIMLRFHLDNPSKDKIERQAVVRDVQEQRVGASFSRNEYDKELGFYLMR